MRAAFRINVCVWAEYRQNVCVCPCCDVGGMPPNEQTATRRNAAKQTNNQRTVIYIYLYTYIYIGGMPPNLKNNHKGGTPPQKNSHIGGMPPNKEQVNTSLRYKIKTSKIGNPDTTGYHPDTTGYHRIPPGYQRIPAGYRPDTTGYHPDTAGYRPDTTGYHPDTTGYRPDTAGYRPDTTGYHPDTTGYHPDTTRIPPDTARIPPDTARIPPGYHRIPPGYHRIPHGYHRIPPGYQRIPPGYHLYIFLAWADVKTVPKPLGIKGLMLEPRCCWNVRLGRVRGPQGSCGLPHTQHPCSTNRKNKQRRGNSYANSRQQVHEQIFQYKNRENRFLRLAVYTTSLLNNTKNKEHGNLYPNPRQRLHELTASKKSMFSLKI